MEYHAQPDAGSDTDANPDPCPDSNPYADTDRITGERGRDAPDTQERGRPAPELCTT